MEYHATLMTSDGGTPRLQRMCCASSSSKCLHAGSVRALYRRRSRHFPCFTSLQSTDSEILSSPAPFILYPLACSSLPYWVGAQLTCRPISSFIHFSLYSSCSCTSKMFIIARYDVQNSSPSSLAMIITHCCSTEPSFTRTFKLISPTNHLH